MKFIFALLLFASLLLAGNVFPQVEGDRILAVVGNDIITESDFQYQVQLYARQNQLTEISPFMAQQVFQSMLTNKLMLAKAVQDSIEVTEDEIDRELQGRMDNLVAQAGSIERLEAAYGISFTKIRNLLKDELRKNLMVEKLKRAKFPGGVKVTDNDVREFFAQYRDSLPDVSEEYELAHIFLIRSISDAEKNEARRIAEDLLDSIKLGADFSELAQRYSADSGSAKLGGDLGYANKGTYVRPFEEAVYSMKVGDVSDVVETEFGMHIIKLTDRQGDKVRSSHILIGFPKFESSDFETISFLEDLKSKIEKGEISFEEAAKKYSQDEFNASKGGYIGKVPVERLDSITIDAIKSVSVGGITDPVRSDANTVEYGYEIFKVINIHPPHALSLDQDYDRIKGYASTYKENKEVEKWIEEIRSSVFVDVKM